ASTAEELASQAMQLQSSIEFFKVDQGGGAGSATPRAGTPPAAAGFSAPRRETQPVSGPKPTAAKTGAKWVSIRFDDAQGAGDARDLEFHRY
ncbi:MAG: methyl-accepting chemotaxis protein, partial [Opitutales bacterium]